MKILLTGGLGYIGSHTAVELIKAGHEVIIVDNLSNSERSVKDKIERITQQEVIFYKADLRKEKAIRQIFEDNTVDAVIHFAGLKAVGESVSKPLEYYENNICGTINLLKVMKDYNVNNLVFSSSATVYGASNPMPLTEDCPTSATNPYGRTKLFIEEILKDYYNANKSMNIVILRYFNPVGAHDSGIIGENPKGIPNNLMPFVAKVACGKLDELHVFGNDYDTKDGTCIRDYIHICDLAEGHLAAVNKLNEKCGLKIYNLGTGTGYSVLDVVNTYNKVCENKVKYAFAPRREGDVKECYACPDKALQELGWQAKRNLYDMCLSSYTYEQNQAKRK